jgi:sugar-specific transcriptional regulator TrmB
MPNDIMEDLRDFLNDANLSAYEVNVIIALITSSKKSPPTAREISLKSSVPITRIYEVLDELCKKGLVEIIESRPKKFNALPLNEAFYNLIDYQTKENKRKIEYLHNRAKLMESDLYYLDQNILKTPTRLFWSTNFGAQSIYLAYAKFINETKDEIIFNNFVNEKTLKILPRGKIVYEPIRNAVEKGVKFKSLFNFQIDERFLTSEIKHESAEIFKKIVKIHEESFGLSTKTPGFEIKYIHQQIPTLYDIFDKKRIIFKLQNLLKTTQIFATMNVIDLDLAEKLRENFLRVWALESIGINQQ